MTTIAASDRVQSGGDGGTAVVSRGVRDRSSRAGLRRRVLWAEVTREENAWLARRQPPDAKDEPAVANGSRSIPQRVPNSVEAIRDQVREDDRRSDDHEQASDPQHPDTPDYAAR